MTPPRRSRIVLTGTLATCLTAAMAAQAPPIRPSSPAVVEAPVWTRALRMPDGRTFVTDGGLSIDVKYAKPDTLPSVVLPPESAKILAGHFTAPYDNESRLGELQPGPFKNTFSTPGGIALNGNYVTFLRRVAPAATTRLRTRGPRDPVIVAIDGEIAGILMPVAPPSK
jgi:hypothetical protein